LPTPDGFCRPSDFPPVTQRLAPRTDINVCTLNALLAASPNLYQGTVSAKPADTMEQPLAEDAQILRCAERCRALFGDLKSLFGDDLENQRALVLDLQQRYQAWAHRLDLFNEPQSSLHLRLRKKPDVRTAILKLLDMLECNLGRSE
jgi:hypothetical protein